MTELAAVRFQPRLLFPIDLLPPHWEPGLVMLKLIDGISGDLPCFSTEK